MIYTILYTFCIEFILLARRSPSNARPLDHKLEMNWSIRNWPATWWLQHQKTPTDYVDGGDSPGSALIMMRRLMIALEALFFARHSYLPASEELLKELTISSERLLFKL